MYSIGRVTYTVYIYVFQYCRKPKDEQLGNYETVAHKISTVRKSMSSDIGDLEAF